MPLVNELIDSIEDHEDAVHFTYKSDSCLKGVVIESGLPFTFEINIELDIALLTLTASGLSSEFLEQLTENQTIGLCIKTGRIHLEKRVFLCGETRGDVWLISQWLMTLICSLGDCFRRERTCNDRILNNI